MDYWDQPSKWAQIRRIHKATQIYIPAKVFLGKPPLLPSYWEDGQVRVILLWVHQSETEIRHAVQCHLYVFPETFVRDTLEPGVGVTLQMNNHRHWVQELEESKSQT